MAIWSTEDNRKVLEAQNKRNQMLADMRLAAHERRMADRKNFVESNPNAVNETERAQFINGDATSRGLQAHERAMLKQQGENQFRVAEQNRFGMREQGMGAAEQNRLSAVEQERLKNSGAMALEQERSKNKLSALEKEWAGRGNVATVEGQTKRDVAETTGRYGVEQAKEQAKLEAARNEMQLQKQREKDDAMLQRKIVEGNAKITVQQYRGYEKQDAEYIGRLDNASKSGEEIAKGLEELHKNDPNYQEYKKAKNLTDGATNPNGTNGPKEGDTQMTKQGKAVYRNGKWVLAQ